MAILTILFLFMRKARIRTFSKQLILWVLITTAFAIIDEPLTWIFDGKQFPGAYLLEYTTNFLLFLVGPVISGLLMSYVDYRLFHDRRRISKRFFYQHASFLTLAMLTLNFFQPVYFSIKAGTNSYSSGPFKLVHYGLLGLSYAYFLLFVTINNQKVTRRETLIYQIFFFIPIAGMLLQLLNSRLHFSWTSIALGLLVIYVFLETTPSEEDHLTKLYNRKSFDQYLHHLIQENQVFQLLVFDLNHFKEINDTYGHEAGDKVLIYFADALKKSFGDKGKAFRLGGDEFAVIYSTDAVEGRLQLLGERLKKHTYALINNLSFSYGCQSYESGMTSDTLNRIADRKMYTLKREMKSQEREHFSQLSEPLR